LANHTPHFKIHTEASASGRSAPFEGPLDLLLQLIEEKHLPINEIAIAEVTEQFLAYLKNLEKVHPEILANFLVVAAKLLVIKSRALLPTLELEAIEDDGGIDLTTQLLLLKKYRDASRFLKNMDNRRRQSFTRDSFLGQQVIFYPDPNITVDVLQTSAKTLASSLQEIAKLPEKSIQEVISISEKIESLQHLIAQKVETKLQDVLKSASSKTEVIVTFLALLELIKQRILTVEQEQLFADIVIKKRHE